jgi:hypothetical protein
MSVRKFSVFLGLSVFLSLSAFKADAHPFYVSVTEIRIDTQKRTLTASCRMFTDDLESALTQIFKRPFDLLKQENDAEVKALLNQYIQERFSIGLGGQLISLSFLGFEHEEEATWCYLEADKLNAGNRMTVTNTLLYDFIPMQEHILHIYINGNRQSARLANPSRAAAFSW